VTALPPAHASDCAPCDAARAVISELRDQFDPLDNWDDTELTVIDAVVVGGRDDFVRPEDEGAERITVTELAVRMAAGVLHKYPIPVKETADARP
jgi:hypothetical protein